MTLLRDMQMESPSALCGYTLKSGSSGQSSQKTTVTLDQFTVKVKDAVSRKAMAAVIDEMKKLECDIKFELKSLDFLPSTEPHIFSCRADVQLVAHHKTFTVEKDVALEYAKTVVGFLRNDIEQIDFNVSITDRIG